MKFLKAVLEDVTSGSKNHSDLPVVAAIAALIGEGNRRAPTTGLSTQSISADLVGGHHG